MTFQDITRDNAYLEEKEKIKDFLSRFEGSSEESVVCGSDKSGLGEDSDSNEAELDDLLKGRYGNQLLRIANQQQKTLIIKLIDILKYEQTGSGLATRIRFNVRRYKQLFCEAVDEMMPEPTREISDLDDGSDTATDQTEIFDVKNDDAEQVGFSAHLWRRYDVCFQPLLSYVTLSVREVRGKHLGKLIAVKGIVAHVSEVKSLFLINVYTCGKCGFKITQDISQKQFIPLTDCPSDACEKDEAGKGTLHMQARASRSITFQEARLEDMGDQVPVKRISRSIVVHLYGERTSRLSPGDVVRIGGTYVRTPYARHQTLQIELTTDTYLEAHTIQQLGRQYKGIELTPQIKANIARLKLQYDLYERLASSIAFEIYGRQDVKKAVLLFLVAGLTKNTRNGTKIRGDINVCLMGLPKESQSQLLEFISRVAPLGVHRTGKRSSGLGLTAVARRDRGTNEISLEGGSLILSDNQLRCIDESRFDIALFIPNKPPNNNDRRYAQHVGEVHLYGRHPEMFGFIDPTLLRYYIVNARLHHPVVSTNLLKYIAKSLIPRRTSSEEEDRYLNTSAHTFHAVIRVSEALARLRCADEVVKEDIDEAMRLMEVGRESLKRSTGEGDEGDESAVNEIFRLIKDMAFASLYRISVGREPVGEGDNELNEEDDGDDEIMRVSMVDLRARVIAKGFTETQLMDTIQQYESINIIELSSNGQFIQFMDAGEDWEG